MQAKDDHTGDLHPCRCAADQQRGRLAIISTESVQPSFAFLTAFYSIFLLILFYFVRSIY